MSIRVNLEPLETMSAFPYLGRTIAFNNSDCVSLYINLKKEKWWWRMMENFLVKAVATVRSRAMMYKSVLQTILIYESRSWVVTGTILKFLEWLDHRVAQRISGIKARRFR